MEPLHGMLAEIIADHPEYQALLEQGEEALARDWTPEQGESNPFLHMSLHSAIREQVSVDRPSGIAAIHRQLSARLGHHEAEHRIMECLARMLWEAAQGSGGMPDEPGYLACLRAVTGSGKGTIKGPIE